MGFSLTNLNHYSIICKCVMETESIRGLELLETATNKYAFAFAGTRIFVRDFNEIYFSVIQVLGPKEFMTW